MCSLSIITAELICKKLNYTGSMLVRTAIHYPQLFDSERLEIINLKIEF